MHWKIPFNLKMLSVWSQRLRQSYFISMIRIIQASCDLFRLPCQESLLLLENFLSDYMRSQIRILLGSLGRWKVFTFSRAWAILAWGRLRAWDRRVATKFPSLHTQKKIEWKTERLKPVLLRIWSSQIIDNTWNAFQVILYYLILFAYMSLCISFAFKKVQIP